MAESAFRHPMTPKTCEELTPRRKKHQIGYQSDVGSIRELKFIGSACAYTLLTLFSSVSETNMHGNGSSILLNQRNPNMSVDQGEKGSEMLLLSSTFINCIYLSKVLYLRYSRGFGLVKRPINTNSLANEVR